MSTIVASPQAEAIAGKLLDVPSVAELELLGVTIRFRRRSRGRNERAVQG